MALGIVGISCGREYFKKVQTYTCNKGICVNTKRGEEMTPICVGYPDL